MESEHGFDAFTGWGACGSPSGATLFEDGDDSISRVVGWEIPCKPGMIRLAGCFGRSRFSGNPKFRHINGVMGSPLGMCNNGLKSLAQSTESFRMNIRDLATWKESAGIEIP